jgi:hypothetical protein
MLVPCMCLAAVTSVVGRSVLVIGRVKGVYGGPEKIGRVVATESLFNFAIRCGRYRDKSLGVRESPGACSPYLGHQLAILSLNRW